MDTSMQEKGNLVARNWGAMDKDILCSIFSRLPFVDVLRVKSICWGWNTAVVDLFKSCAATSSFTEIPWLIYTLEPKEYHEVSEGEKASRFVNIEENKIYPFNGLAVKKMNDCSCYCVGSSHDWLIFEDGQGTMFLLNPFTSHKIDLPGGVSLVQKGVLSSSPSIDNNYYLAIVHRYPARNRGLTFCKDGDSSWTELQCSRGERYDDIIFHKNQLYGLYEWSSLEHGYRYSIRVWDMNHDGCLLVRNIDLVLEELITRPPPIFGYGDLLDNTYLVESQGSLLFVTRFKMYRNSNASEIQDLGDAPSRFYVFKLDANKKISGGALTSMSGFSLFLGSSRSISVDVRNCKMLKQDAIYFNAAFGQFSGVFTLKDSSWLYAYEHRDRQSVATWVVPCMKRLN